MRKAVSLFKARRRRAPLLCRGHLGRDGHKVSARLGKYHTPWMALHWMVKQCMFCCHVHQMLLIARVSIFVGAPAQAADDPPIPSSRSISDVTSSASAMAKPQFVNVSDRSINDARLAAAAATKSQVAIVVWGGTKDLQHKAYKAAADLVGEGIPAAFVIAPDHNTTPHDAVFQVFAKSIPTGEDSHIGTNYVHLVRDATHEHAKHAHHANF